MTSFAQAYLTMQGHLAPAASANPGFTRLYGASLTEYVELNQFDIQPGTGPFLDNQLATYTVPVESRLFPTGYSGLVTPPTFSTGPVVPPKIKLVVPVAVSHPIPGIFTASDGTKLTETRNSAGQIIGFTGTSKNNQTYSLSIQNALLNGPGRDDKTNVQWYNITASFMEAGEKFADGLKFGFSYCPWADLLEIFLVKSEVEAGIRIDLIPFTPATQTMAASDTMTAQRNFWFDDYSYSSQQATIVDNQADPEIYLPVVAAFWPYLNRLAYFEPAIESMIGSSTAGMTAVATPISNFANLAGTLIFPTTQQAFADKVTSAIGSAIGPFAASFISKTETAASALSYLALWLGGITAQGFGNADFLAEVDYFFKQAQLFWQENSSKSGPQSPVLQPKPTPWVADYKPITL